VCADWKYSILSKLSKIEFLISFKPTVLFFFLSEFHDKVTCFVEKQTNMVANHVFEAIKKNLSLRGNQINFFKKKYMCILYNYPPKGGE